MGAVKALATRRPAPRPAPAPRVPAPAQARLIQPALRVGAVNDPAEHEAEAMAAHAVAQVTSAPPPVEAAPTGASGPTAAPLARAASDQPNTDSLVEPPVPADQADITLPPANDVPTETLTSADVTEMETGEPAGEVPQAPAQALRRTEAVLGRAGGLAPADVAARVANPGQGRGLPEALRAQLEPVFGTSFADVRLHDTAEDRDAAGRIGARAFAHGQHVWLGPGETASDLRLMAHELTHVVQQTEGSAALPLNRAPIRREEGFLAGRGERIARQVPGYTLLTVLLGRTLISDERVTMTATNLLGGLFGLVPGGTAIFDKLNETRAVDDAFTWVQGRLSDLNITWDRISGLLSRVLDAVASLSPIDNLTALFRPLVDDIITFVGEITRKVLEFVIKGALKLAGPYADQVWQVIQKAGETLDIIVKDPLGFARNLIRAVVGGFTQFGTNIIEHLKKGVLGWLFGALGAELQMPERLDFKGLMSLVLQILGLTYANFRRILVRQLGPRGEKMVAFVEKSIEFVQILLREGFLGVWQKILSMIENFKQTLIGGMTEMVTSAIVTAGIKWLASLTNPVGAVVRVVLSIYDMVVTFLERVQQIWEVAQSIFNSVGAIARGQVQEAANFVEQTIGRTVPVVLSFLAALLGLNGIPARIKAVFERLRAPVDRAMTKLVDFLIKKAKALFSKLIGKVNGKRALPGKPFKVGETEHSLFSRKKGKGLEFMIASEPAPMKTVEEATKAEIAKVKDAKSKENAGRVLAEVVQADKALDKYEKVDPENEKTPNAKPVADMAKVIETNTAEINAEAADVDTSIALSSKVETGVALFRAKEPRVEGFEGMADGSYKALQGKRDAFKDKEGKTVENLSKYYELDHTIEERFPIALAPILGKLKPRPGNTQSGPALKRDGQADPTPGTAAAEQAPLMGKLGTGEYVAPKDGAPQFPAIALYHGNHIKKKGKGLPGPKEIIDLALKEGGADPAGKAKSLLKRQLEVELLEIQQVVSGDKDASDTIKANVAKGLGVIRAENEELYDLSKVTAAADQRETRQPLVGGKGSEFPLQGDPDFTLVEGVGTRYGQRKSGWGAFLEYDHIVDNAYPEAARAMPLLSGPAFADVEAAARSPGRMGRNQAARLNALRTTLLFAGTRMADYTVNDGYSLPLYRIIHKLISPPGVPGPILAKARDGVTAAQVAKLASYVREGGEATLSDVVANLRAPVLKAFLDRVGVHGREVEKAYEANEAKVVEINSAVPAQDVRAKFGKIRGNIRTSLSKAEIETKSLF